MLLFFFWFFHPHLIISLKITFWRKSSQSSKSVHWPEDAVSYYWIIIKLKQHKMSSVLVPLAAWSTQRSNIYTHFFQILSDCCCNMRSVARELGTLEHQKSIRLFRRNELDLWISPSPTPRCCSLSLSEGGAQCGWDVSQWMRHVALR